MFNSEEPPHKKRKEEASPWQSPLDDIAINCLARVSRLEHANLSLVSKSYYSLVSSPYFCKMQSLMGRKEPYVYVCLRTPHEPRNPKWYILRCRKNVEEFNLFPIPSLPSQPSEKSSVVVLDCEIYLIGGLINGDPTSCVWVLDCKTHMWREIPSMKMARAKADAGVVDGKIYVFGGHKINEESSSYGEVFDPKTQTWHNFREIENQQKFKWCSNSTVVIDKKIYAMDGSFLFINYSPSESKWEKGYLLNLLEYSSLAIWDWCMIDDILYCLDSFGIIYWFEPNESNWVEPYPVKPLKEVKGLESLMKSLYKSKVVNFNEEGPTVMNFPQRLIDVVVDRFTGARMSNSGGNIVLFWDVIEGDHLDIWCAEISLERRQGGHIWGNILWSNAIMSGDHFKNRYKVLYSVSVTV